MSVASVLKIAVAVVTFYGVFTIVRTIRFAHRDYQPHLLFIAWWMAVTASCMLLLVGGYLLEYMIEILNASALFMVGGWVTFLTRVSKDTQRFRETMKEAPE